MSDIDAQQVKNADRALGELYDKQLRSGRGAYLSVRESLGPTPQYVPVSARPKKIAAYFKAGNDTDALADCATEEVRYNVSEPLKKAVIKRDAHRCLVCGGSDGLKIDHIRALENGGDNSPDNLATLCSTCFKMKRKHDKNAQLRRQKTCRSDANLAQNKKD